LIRPEATGYGLIYFLEEMIKGNGDELKVLLYWLASLRR
jgi:glutamate dehydrogenase/leucine dehydrogenase